MPRTQLESSHEAVEKLISDFSKQGVGENRNYDSGPVKEGYLVNHLKSCPRSQNRATLSKAINFWGSVFFIGGTK
jgi:hypothetical protein